MPRYLKTEFPCVWCRKPTKVCRLDSGPEATCERCSEARRLIQRAHLNDQQADREIEQVNEKEENAVPLLIGWLKASICLLEGAQAYLEATSSALPSELRTLVRGAHFRVKETMKILPQLEPFLVSAVDEVTCEPGLEVIAGEALAGELRPRPALRLVSAEPAP